MNIPYLLYCLEATAATDDEYFALAGKHAPVALLQMGEFSAELMSGGSPTITRKSDSGNLVIRWKENDEAIFFLGMVSVTGKTSKADAKDLREWHAYFLDKLRSGIALLTTPNAKSAPFLDNIARDLEREGKTVNRIEAGGNIMLSAS